MDQAIPIIFIPGNVTDWRMYTPQLRVFPQIIVPPWLPPLHDREPLAEYAARLVARIDLPEKYLFGGVSLGGMIAQEMAHHAQPVGLVLIATCQHSQAIPWGWRLLGRFVRHLPNRCVKAILLLLAKAIPPLLTRNRQEQQIYAAMLRDVPPNLARWQSSVATRWQLSAPLDRPVAWIHGTDDAMIRYRDANATHTIVGGGHFINITHADDVNHFIAAQAHRFGTNP